MKTKPALDFTTAAASFLDLSELKVWSVVVTIMGDLSPDDAMSGPVLTAIIERMGLQAQAMRVALHRLKRDGWIESERVGRIGYYRLTKMARVNTRLVHDRVFATSVPRLEKASIVIAPPGSAAMQVDPATAIDVMPRVMISGDDRADLPSDYLVAPIEIENLPAWTAPMIEAQANVASYATLSASLEALLTVSFDDLSLIDAVALRVLVLHRWRRLVLRSNPTAEAVLQGASAPAQCRAKIMRIFAALPRPNLDDLGDAIIP